MKKMAAFFALLISAPVLINAQTDISKFNHTYIDQNLITLNFIKNISFTAPVNIQSDSSDSKVLKQEENKKVVIESTDAIEKISARQIKYAMLMDVAVESIKDVLLFDFLEEWYGTRYRMGGTTKKGIDCSALTQSLMFWVYELKIPRTAREQYKNCRRIKKDELMEGDLVFFNTRGGVSHVGLYITNGYFVHSSSSEGVTISNLEDTYFSRRFIGGGRVESILDSNFRFPIYTLLFEAS